MNQKIHHYKTINATALTSSLIISLIPCFIVGGDFWAEAFAEYFDTIKNIESILNIGWGGYYSFFPQFVAAIYNEYLVGFTSPWFTARFFSSLVFLLQLSLACEYYYYWPFLRISSTLYLCWSFWGYHYRVYTHQPTRLYQWDISFTCHYFYL